jgi:ribonuclease HII
MFGRVYAAACVLPRHDDTFDYTVLKDSKRFTSRKRIEAVDTVIREGNTIHHVAYEESGAIDHINIRNATLKCMNRAIRSVFDRVVASGTDPDDILILVDGKDFRPMTYFCKTIEQMRPVRHQCVIGGDDLYGSIAAASILAKVARDTYIYNLCDAFPMLDEYYGLSKNKGYGTAAHMKGIDLFGITKWHRTSYGNLSERSRCSIGCTDGNDGNG